MALLLLKTKPLCSFPRLIAAIPFKYCLKNQYFCLNDNKILYFQVKYVRLFWWQQLYHCYNLFNIKKNLLTFNLLKQNKAISNSSNISNKPKPSKVESKYRTPECLPHLKTGVFKWFSFGKTHVIEPIIQILTWVKMAIANPD